MNDSGPMISPGAQVRLIDNPSRTGIAMKLEQIRNGVRYVCVQFGTEREFHKEIALEEVPEAPEHPLDFLQQGRFADVAALRRALTHVRLTGKLSDVIYSMEATDTEFHAFQFKPVLKMLQSPVNGLLIADEVGLGKTIEAGLIWTELRSRFDANRLMVLCPAALREKWKAELSRRFGVMAQIADADEVADTLNDDQSQRTGFALIGSVQGLRPRRKKDEDYKRESGARRLGKLLENRGQAEQLIDLLVIDEAHHLRNPETSSHELGRLLKATSGYVVLLTATPIHNKNEDLLALLQLLDSAIFRTPADFKDILEANRPLVTARDLVLRGAPSRAKLVSYVDEARTHRILQNNRQLAVMRQELTASDSPLDEQARSHIAWQFESANLLGHVVTRTRKRDVQEYRVTREPNAEFVPMTFEEEDFYQRVTEAVREYCEGRDLNEKFVLVTPQRQITSSMPAALRSWRRRAGIEDAESLSWRVEPSNASTLLGPLTMKIIDEVARDVDLDGLIRNDTKFNRLCEVLRDFWLKEPTAKVILFSTFRATLAYLQERLEAEGIGTSLLWGGGDRAKDEVINEFRDDSNRKILLSSEVGGEGVDLQFCWMVINFDMPWNPMRVEQRIGRVDRLGQKSDKVLIWNLFYGDTIDARIYTRLYDKLNLCTVALGDFEALLGEQFQDLGIALLTSRLTKQQQEERIEQTRFAIENKRRHEEHLEEEAHTLVAYGDYVIDKVHAAKQMQRWITSQDLLVYTQEFLAMFAIGSELRHVDEDRYVLTLSTQARTELATFISRTRSSRGTALARTGSVPVIFENSVVDPRRGDAEVISQFHPLIRFAATRLNDAVERVRPAVAIDLRHVASPPVPEGDYVFAAMRWSSNGVQTVERLVYAARRMDSGEMLSETAAELLVTACVADGTYWYEAAGTLDLNLARHCADIAYDALEKAHVEAVLEIDARNLDRADVAQHSLEHHLAQQRILLGEIIAKHAAAANLGLFKSETQRLARLEASIGQKLATIRGQRETDHRKQEVLVGVVRV